MITIGISILACVIGYEIGRRATNYQHVLNEQIENLYRQIEEERREVDTVIDERHEMVRRELEDIYRRIERLEKGKK